MANELPALAPDRLQVLVFGPGTGELVVVRAPPNDWMVIDGCRIGTTSYGLRTIEHYGAKSNVRLVALSHPHLDHAGGFAELVDAVAPTASPTWPLLGLLWPAPLTGRVSRDAATAFREARVHQALASIRGRWRRRPTCRWPMNRGDERRLGDARVRVLSPTTAARDRAFAAWAGARRHDDNQVATALEVQWHGRRLVLGADLVERPGSGWSAVLAFDRNVVRHAGLKVPHHGSDAALHDPLLAKQDRLSRTFVVTPFASRDLPRFGAKEGVGRLLAVAPEVHLTALPRDHDRQAGTPLRVRRSALARHGKSWAIDPPTPGFPDCWVMLEVEKTGAPTIVHGRGSVVVTRG